MKSRAVMDEEVDKLIDIMEEIARSNYSDAIMEFTQPWHSNAVSRIAEAMAMLMVKIEAREFRLEGLVAELQQANERLKRNILQTVMTVANALAARDAYTAGHAVRVTDYAVRLARRRGLGEDEIESVRIGAMLHDIGKIGFSDRVFSREDAMPNKDLVEEIHRHPDIAIEILKDIDFLEPAFEGILYHHERLDGSGYPAGLRGDQIPIAAQIIAVADSFDAMTTDRPYQPGRTKEEALTVLEGLSGRHLDRDLVELFIQEIEDNGWAGSRPIEPAGGEGRP